MVTMLTANRSEHTNRKMVVINTTANFGNDSPTCWLKLLRFWNVCPIFCLMLRPFWDVWLLGGTMTRTSRRKRRMAAFMVDFRSSQFGGGLMTDSLEKIMS